MEIWNGSEKFAKLYHCKYGWANYNNWSTVSVQGLHIFSSSLFKRFLSYRELRQMPPDTSPSLRTFSDKKLTLTAGWGSFSDMNRVIYWKVSRITDIIHSQVKIGFQFFIYIWFLFTLTFTITSTIHNYDKNLEKKRTCCSRSIFHHYMFKVIIKILPSVTGDRTKWSSLGCSLLTRLTFEISVYPSFSPRGSAGIILGSRWLFLWMNQSWRLAWICLKQLFQSYRSF